MGQKFDRPDVTDCTADAALRQIDRYLLSELRASDAVRLGSGAGRRRTAVLLSMLGHPQNDVPTVHVAGTAGKGSVTTLLANILSAHGFRVGSNLSPHAHSVLERFQIDGSPAPANLVAAAMGKVREKDLLLRRSPLGQVTMFEAATATAFQMFRDIQADYAVVETGLGGLHDATNTITRSDKLAVLTAIGYDHTAILGETLTAIAGQKAGILPAGGEAFVLGGDREIDEAVATEAQLRGCAVYSVPPAVDNESLPPDLRPALSGAHQRINARLAMCAARHLARRDRWRFDAVQAARAVASTSMPGRFELRRWGDRPVILDGAHNELKLAALAQAVCESYRRPPVWILAMKDDKDILGAVTALRGSARVLVATQFGGLSPDWSQTTAVPAAALAAAARTVGLAAVTRSDMAEALACAADLSQPAAPIVVSGSFLAVAEAGRLLPSASQ